MQIVILNAVKNLFLIRFLPYIICSNKIAVDPEATVDVIPTGRATRRVVEGLPEKISKSIQKFLTQA